MIKSEKELLEYISQLEEEAEAGSKLFYRGQTVMYENMRSGKARPNVFINREVENGWNTIVGRLIDDKTRTSRYKQSILQHYGLPTFYLDLTVDPLTACFFACNRYEKQKPMLWIGDTFRYHDETKYIPIKEGKGYFIILEIPNAQKLIDENILFDISTETRFVRPQNQSGYLILDQPPIEPNPNNFIKEIIEIDRSKFDCSLSISDLFPHPKIDKGYSELLDVPFIQLPSYYTKDKGKVEESKDTDEESKEAETEEDKFDMDKYFVLGKRVIDIPFYIKDQNDLFNYNPKWKDITIFEPSPFRLWKTHDFELSRAFKGQSGNFKDTVKVTITPNAKNIIENYNNEIDLEWPNLNSDSIFFTYAVEHHDKVITHSAPYWGKWLHRNSDLILELQLFADDADHIELQRGHGYIKDGNQMTYVKVEGECDCNEPNKHLEWINSFLKIHNLIKKGEIALVQHPFYIENWYVLI